MKFDKLKDVLQSRFEKRSYSFDLIAVFTKTQLQTHRSYCGAIQAAFVNATIGNATIAYSYVFGVYGHVFEMQLQPMFFVVIYQPFIQSTQNLIHTSGILTHVLGPPKFESKIIPGSNFCSIIIQLSQLVTSHHLLAGVYHVDMLW